MTRLVGGDSNPNLMPVFMKLNLQCQVCKIIIKNIPIAYILVTADGEMEGVMWCKTCVRETKHKVQK
jgi:hypothetical protein